MIVILYFPSFFLTFIAYFFYVVFKVNHYKIPRKFVKIGNVDVDICTLFSEYRIYQDVEMSFTKVVTARTPGLKMDYTKRGEEDKNLLDISADDFVFYVGGYPDTFTVRT